MSNVRSLIFELTCVLLTINDVWSSDTSVIEYLLDDKLSSWRKNVTHKIKEEVLQEILASLETETKTLRNRYQTEKLILRETRDRVEKLEEENILLREINFKLKMSTKDSCFPQNTSGAYGGRGNRYTQLAIGEQKTGDIYLMDIEGTARWKVASSQGILGMAYHPIIKILYMVTASKVSAIHSLNVFRNQQRVLRKCGLCLAISLDAKENILYFLQKMLKNNNVYVLRLYLKTSKINKRPLVKYSRNESPSTLAVDDVNQHVFIVVRGKGLIEQIDYSGKKIGEITVDQLIDERSITFNIALNKIDNILYYNVDYELWQKNLVTDDGPELAGIADLTRLSGLSFVNNQLWVAYMESKQVDVWTKKGGFQRRFDLGSVESGSKHICMFG